MGSGKARPLARLRLAVRAIASALADAGQPAMLIGGVAAIIHGVPRVTRDVDATIAGSAFDFEEFLSVAQRHHIEPRIPDAVLFARQNLVFLLRHVPSQVDIDLSLAWLAFEIEAISAAESVSLFGTRVRLVRPEDLVIYKLIAWRPQDRQDVERLLALHGARMDSVRLRRLSNDVAVALDDRQRHEDFLELLRRILPE